VFSVPPLTPLVKQLLILLFAAFVLEVMLPASVRAGMVALLTLDPDHLSPLTLPQLVTYVLVEERNLNGMLFGMVFTWLIVSPFEATFGKRATIELVLAGILGGSLAVLIVSQIASMAPYRFFGSFPIAYAGMTAMAQVMRGGRMMFFGILPMTSKQLLLVIVVLAVVQYGISRDHLVLAATLGSMLAGAGYVRYMARPPRPSKPKRPGAGRFRVLRGGADGDDDRPKWLN
jgi:membrane associated rhomboid family serine protease